MKLHEKAKELNLKANELISFLQKSGHEEVKGINQILSEEQLLTADSYYMTSFPSSKNFEETDECFTLSFNPKTFTVNLRKMNISGLQCEITREIDEAKFPSKHQAFSYIEYLLAKIDNGSFDK
jgi:hypothetical protein